jgi:hypothetical protein
VEIAPVLKFEEIFEELKVDESTEYHLYGKIIHTVFIFFFLLNSRVQMQMKAIITLK